MSMFKKAISATKQFSQNVSTAVVGDKNKEKDKDKDDEREKEKERGSARAVPRKVEKKAEFAPEVKDNKEEPSETPHSDDIDQSVLDMLDELQDASPSSPTAAATSPTSASTPASRPAGPSHTRTPSSGGNSSSSLNVPGSSASPSPSSSSSGMIRVASSSSVSNQDKPKAGSFQRSTSGNNLNTSGVSSPPRFVPPLKKIPVPPNSNEVIEPNYLGPAKFAFNIITTIPLAPKFVTFIIAVFLPRGGTKIVLRRYKHIEELQSQLSQTYEEFPPLPANITVDPDKATSLHIEDLRIRVQNFLNSFGHYPQLINQLPMMTFVGGPPQDPRKLTVKPRRGDFDDEEVDDKLRRDLTEVKIQEGLESFVQINTTLGKVCSFEALLLRAKGRADWRMLSEGARAIAMLGKILETQPLEANFVAKHISDEQADAITEFGFRTVVDATIAAVSEITSRLRRMWCTHLEPSVSPEKVGELKQVAQKLLEPFYLYNVISPMAGYKIEYGTPDFSWKSWPSNFGLNSPWFHDYFFNKAHVNLMGTSQQTGPIVISFMAEETPDKYSYFRAIVRSEKGNVKLISPARGREQADWQRDLNTIKDVLERMEPNTRLAELSVVKEELTDELLVFESRDMRVTPHFKFGVLYCMAGQKTEEEMFMNNLGTPDYERFLELLGEKVALANWNRYNGGLDIRGTNATGSHSVFTTFSGYDIMYHVSTLFPLSTEGGTQQVHKKRHLGNDIIMVVFQDEGSEDYLPNCVRSQYIQVVIVVRKLKAPADCNDVFYKVSVVRNSDVPTFGPPLPFPPIFKHGPEFRSWLLRKMVNGELSAYRSPLFIKQLSAGFRAQCEDLFGKYYKPPTKASSIDDMAKNSFKTAGKVVSGVGKGVSKLIGGRKEKEEDNRRDSYNQ